jgi:hypothetical protein
MERFEPIIKTHKSVVLLLFVPIFLGAIIGPLSFTFLENLDSYLFFLGYLMAFPYSIALVLNLKRFDFAKERLMFWVLLSLSTLIAFGSLSFYLFFTLQWFIFPVSFLLTLIYLLRK